LPYKSESSVKGDAEFFRLYGQSQRLTQFSLCEQSYIEKVWAALKKFTRRYAAEFANLTAAVLAFFEFA
jgi:hypothetical protein